MHVTAPLAGDERRQHRLGFLGLLVGLAIGGTTLLRVAGPPTLPTELPSTAILASTLNGSYGPGVQSGGQPVGTPIPPPAPVGAGPGHWQMPDYESLIRSDPEYM